jgi:hypothetical protein
MKTICFAFSWVIMRKPLLSALAFVSLNRQSELELEGLHCLVIYPRSIAVMLDNIFKAHFKLL